MKSLTQFEGRSFQLLSEHTRCRSVRVLKNIFIDNVCAFHNPVTIKKFPGVDKKCSMKDDTEVFTH